jgi:hypothetical protein
MHRYSTVTYEARKEFPDWLAQEAFVDLRSSRDVLKYMANAGVARLNKTLWNYMKRDMTVQYVANKDLLISPGTTLSHASRGPAPWQSYIPMYRYTSMTFPTWIRILSLQFPERSPRHSHPIDHPRQTRK